MADTSKRHLTFLVQDELGEPAKLRSLPTIAVDASRNDRLNDLAKQAFEQAGFGNLDSPRILFIEVGGGSGPQLAMPPDVAVDEHGKLFWRVGPGSAATTIADLERAAAEGLFEGDPHTFWVGRGGWGDSGLVVYWDDLIRALEQIGAVGAGLATVAAAARRLTKVIVRHLSAWESRHARFPNTFFNSVTKRAEWDPGKLARLLDVPEEDVGDLLVGLGYEKGSDGKFRKTNDPDKAHLRKRLAQEHFLWDGWHDPEPAVSDEDPSE